MTGRTCVMGFVLLATVGLGEGSAQAHRLPGAAGAGAAFARLKTLVGAWEAENERVKMTESARYTRVR